MLGKGAVKEKVVDDLRMLSKKSRREAEDFITYLRIKEELAATKEIMDDEGFVESILRGEADIKAGRLKGWKDVKEATCFS